MYKIVLVIAIVLFIYWGLNLILFRFTFQNKTSSKVASVKKIILIIWMIAYPLGRIFEILHVDFLATFLVVVGSWWMAFAFYLSIIAVFMGIISLLLGRIVKFRFKYKNKIVPTSYIITTVVVCAGYINALSPIVTRFDDFNTKGTIAKDSYKIVFVSDIHLGTIIGNGRLDNLVKMVNSENADLILFGGDVFDEDLGPVIKNNMGEQLSQIKSRLGTIAVTGNHEYIGNASKAISYLKEHGITVLVDSVVNIEGKFLIIGRDDYSSSRFNSQPRKDLKSLIGIERDSLFTIVLDHQPHSIKESVANRISLHLSGHTHHGQMWPLNYLTSLIFDISRGLKIIEETAAIVSTGYGTWGPPIRTGNRPEIVVLKINI